MLSWKADKPCLHSSSLSLSPPQYPLFSPPCLALCLFMSSSLSQPLPLQYVSPLPAPTSLQTAEAGEAIQERNTRLARARQADRSALHAQALTNIAMARERLDKLIIKADSVALDKELETAMDAATKAVFGAETLRDMTATVYVQRHGGGRVPH